MSIDKDKLCKILALATNGSPGERQNAQAFLDRYLIQLNLTIDDLLQEDSHWYSFHFKNKAESLLLTQIVMMVLNVPRVNCRKPRRYCLHFKMIPSQYLEVSFLFSEYSAELEKEQEALVVAFLSVNQIFPEDDGQPRSRKLSRSLIELYQRAGAQSAGLEPVQIRRRLGSGDGVI